MTLTDSKWQLRAWLIALFLMIVGAKLWVIQIYGSSLPFWDQWREAKQLFKPWLEGTLNWGALIAPHNEHRILLTRLLDLSLLWLNRQWNPLLQMVVNAFLHAGYACGLAYCLWTFLGKQRIGLICLLLAPFFMLPFAAENIIHGFQSQEYLLVIFSVLAIVGLGFGPPGSGRWYLGLTAAFLSLFTMASGLLASLTVATLAVLRIYRHKSTPRSHFITLACSLAVFIVGCCLSIPVSDNKEFQGQSVSVVLYALANNLAWPFQHEPIVCIVICLPLVVLFVQYLRANFKELRAAEFILAFGLWGLLQVIALSYGRAATSNSRYLDTLAIIPIASLASLLVLAKCFARRLVLLLTVVWVGLCFSGLCEVSRTMVNYLQWSKQLSLIAEANVQAFMATNDARYLTNQPDLYISYWNGPELMNLLHNPKLSAVLPPICQAPTDSHKTSRLSSGVSGLLNNAAAILLAGLCLGAVLIGRYILARNPFKAR